MLRNEKGFTLVELMVVVAIIAILAAIGIPKMTSFIKTAATAEAVTQMGNIGKAIRGYIDSHPTATPSELKTALEGKVLATGTTDSTSLSTLIPTLTIASNAKFAYKVRSIVITSNRTATFCLQATEGSTFAGDATVASVYFSETVPTGANATIWEGQIFRAGYIDGVTALTSAGDCPTATGTQG
ncbi:MAG: prepilin-type N-terminal cleavage/methylation domain-containing protein [Magnetococcales bacterium]|nr:prepilin-type N-terminal cleavage/methylation domain-containing protein [Magnetococcales bacterium]MBF0150077.1 prepilin-type N-terminal cleavage/methylation domain-containing protein [Magnetococcales bacterium]